MALNGTINAGFTLTEVTQNGTPEKITRVIANALNSFSVGDGNGDNLANKVWAVREALAGVTRTWDLTALPLPNVAANGTGSPILTLAKVKGIFALNESATDGTLLYLGNAGSNPWSALWDTATNRLKLMPNSPWMATNLLTQATNPWTVDATHKNLLIDPGTAALTYTLLLFGV